MTTDSTRTRTPDTVALIHGLWMTALSWEHWVERYERRGFKVVARSWPGMDGDIDALRADSAAIDDLGIEEIVDHFAGIVEELDSAPIIMGHSFGGAFTQILLDRGLGAAGSRSTRRRSRACSPCLPRPSSRAFPCSRTRRTGTGPSR